MTKDPHETGHELFTKSVQLPRLLNLDFSSQTTDKEEDELKKRTRSTMTNVLQGARYSAIHITTILSYDNDTNGPTQLGEKLRTNQGERTGLQVGMDVAPGRYITCVLPSAVLNAHFLAFKVYSSLLLLSKDQKIPSS